MLNTQEIEQIIDQALAEDLMLGDITTETLVNDDQHGKASIIAKAKGIIAGTEIAKQVFLKVDSELIVDIIIKDGDYVKTGGVIISLEGKAASILKAERVALNFLQHLSGIASETARYVKAIEGLSVKITDTRKTIPGLRTLQKYAVQVGGGKNHRMHLGDGILIKDNHLAILRSQGLNMEQIISIARQKASPALKIEIEVKTPHEAAEATKAGADIIMLDNMNLVDMRQAVQLIKGQATVEASGGITLHNIRAIAETGVDIISTGALTHSIKAMDISLKLD